jgi:protein gp37
VAERSALDARRRGIFEWSGPVNKTPIEWTDFTVNPFRFRNRETGKVGHHCTKISPGCKNCYSGKMQTGPYLSGLDFIAENKSKGEFFLDVNALQQVLRRRKPARIFWEDMSDMFLEDYPDEWIDRCFAVMALTPHLTHQVLTKREKRLREYFGDEEDVRDLLMRWGAAAGCLLDGSWIWNEGKHLRGRIERFISYAHGLEEDCETFVSPEHEITYPLPNVWLGVSVEDQQRADERIPLLLRTPAAVRFISAEPLLGPVDLTQLKIGAHIRAFMRQMAIDAGRDPEKVLAECRIDDTPWKNALTGAWFDGWDGDDGTADPKLDWVIVGGESGPGARPCDVAHVRSVVTQCRAAGVPVFVKQLGAFPRFGITGRLPGEDIGCVPGIHHPKGGAPEEWPADLRVREMPSTGPARPPAGGRASNSSNPGASS